MPFIFLKRRLYENTNVALVWGCFLAWAIVVNRLSSGRRKVRCLFDGSDTAAWRGLNSQTFPEQGWSVKDGVLVCDPVEGSGAISLLGSSTRNFELELEFKITRAATAASSILLSNS